MLIGPLDQSGGQLSGVNTA